MIGALKPIVFDFGGVVQQLVDEEIVSSIADALDVSIEHLRTYFTTAIRNVQRGEVSERQFLQDAAARFGNPSCVVPESVFTAPFAEDSRLFPEMVRLLDDLQGRGATLAVLSNTVPVHARLNRERNNFRWFGNRVFLSCDMHMVKPSREIFEAVATGLQVPLSSFLLIDDVAENATQARALGIAAIQHDSATMPIDGVSRAVHLHSAIDHN
jgi:HAD superfamily hydrolase (TIGR01509 family)